MHPAHHPLARRLPLLALALVACGAGDPADSDAGTTVTDTTTGTSGGTAQPTTGLPGASTSAGLTTSTTTTSATTATATTTGDDPDTATGTTGGEVGFDEDLPYGGRFYGVAASGRGPGNTRFATMAAHRLRAEKSGYATAVRWNNRYDHQGGNVGYSIGDGGDVRVELRADDGTDAHLPADTVLAQTAVLEHMIEQPEFPLVEFAEPAWLDAGQLYHIVYVQLGEPGNEVSINDLHNFTYGSPKSPFFDDDFATLIHRENTGWSRRARYIPLFELHYDDGVVKGQGNLGGRPEVDSIKGTVKSISGALAAREQIVVDGPTRVARALWVRPWRVEGDDPLRVCLRTGAGEDIECFDLGPDQVSAPYNDQNFDCNDCGDCDDCESCGGKNICGGCDACDAGTNVVEWIRLEFAESRTLESGAAYSVEFTGEASSTYRVTAMYGAGHTKDDSERFGEDKQVLTWRAEYTVDGGQKWTGWTNWDVDDRSDHHLGVLFELE